MSEVPNPALTMFLASAIRGFDADDASLGAAGVVAQHGRIIDSGAIDDLKKKYGGDAIVVDLTGRLLIPGMVNAHAHLELTAIGPQPYGGDFVGWVKMLREHWPGEGDAFAKQADEAWFALAAADGAQRSLAAGVCAIGDITRFDRVAEARHASGLAGVSFIELFGMGPPWDEIAIERLRHSADGFQPHAPYSAGPSVFTGACDIGLPLTTHLAETLDEKRFVGHGEGPFLTLLQRLGKWSDAFASAYGMGLSPVQWMRPYLERRPWLLAHCNYVDDDDIALLACSGASVAYCPIASEYFEHPAAGHPQHRYREMLEAGVNVCLGTDSIVCQPVEEPQPLGILPQARRLYRRDRTDPDLLLRMATGYGRRALDMDDTVTMLASVQIDAGDPTDPWVQVLLNDHTVHATPLNTIGKASA